MWPAFRAKHFRVFVTTRSGCKILKRQFFEVRDTILQIQPAVPS
jgi:hypothetical protein